MMKKLIAVTILTLAASLSWAAFWQVGDDDGYGIGIPDNTDHPFDGSNAGHDGRTADEVAATDGAQYTDTYSTTHQQYSPADQTGNLATFSFTGLGNGWTEGSMWFDMADFQASTFGAVATTYNGIAQNWAFNDGFPSTQIHFFDLGQDVLDSINSLGVLDVVIDRNASADFYGFDYALLSDRRGDIGNPIGEVPVPAAIWLFGTALIGFIGVSRRRKVA
jgi:hypothetical protein